MPSWRRPLMWPRFSSSEPSHQTMWSGFVRRADSSTQFSSGVDTQPPKVDAGTARGEAARARRTGGAEVPLRKKCRAGGRELQGGGISHRDTETQRTAKTLEPQMNTDKHR